MKQKNKICKIESCNNPARTKDWCAKHYNRWWANGTTKKNERKSLQMRFEEKYIRIPESGCWLWMGAIERGGYGKILAGKCCKKTHRISWELYRGPIPKGRFVLHKCDVPSCVNPDHLFLGTHQDNMADKHAKGRETRGETHSKTTLSNVEVVAIKKSTKLQRILAKEYNVSPKTISKIKTGRTWGHIS